MVVIGFGFESHPRGGSGGVNLMAMEFFDGTLGEKTHGKRTKLKRLLNVINGDTNERE